jgi:hypothetical protein
MGAPRVKPTGKLARVEVVRVCHGKESAMIPPEILDEIFDLSTEGKGCAGFLPGESAAQILQYSIATIAPTTTLSIANFIFPALGIFNFAPLVS